MSSLSKKLHLGCFDQPIPGWINTDITYHIFIAKVPGLAYLLHKIGKIPKYRYLQHKQGVFRPIKYMDVTKRFPFKNDVFDYVFSSHMLEHLYAEDAIACVNEVYRVLRKGGVFRVSIPDLDRIVESYDPHIPNKFLEAIFESKQKLDKNKHHWHYNEASMTTLLTDAGFSEVYRAQFQVGKCVDLKKTDNRPESLFMEAIK